MKRQMICSLSLSCSLFACAHHPKHEPETTVAVHEPAAEERAEVVPEHKHEHHRRVASADDTNVAPDNTGVNERDSSSDAVTPMDQGNGEIDLDLTQRIRSHVVSDDTLSFTAKNVKIISANGHVTLRGPVNSEAEKTTIGKVALDAAGAGHVTNDLEVKP
jgi:osmotically-inducible protein OsmY